ncbi:hypothetical protein Tco_0247060 [Tanacetum coccineum]
MTDSSLRIGSDPLPSGVNAEDVRSYMRTEGNVVASMSGFLKFPMAHGVQIGHGTVLRPNKVIMQNTTPPLPASILILAKSDFQRVIERGYERILVAKKKKKSQEGQNKAAEKVNDQLKGNLERLTVDLSQAKVFRHNYIRQLLPTIVQRLLASEEYKKSLLEPFNQAIIIGWSEGVMLFFLSDEEKAQAILTTADDYDPECHAKFKSAFDSVVVRVSLSGEACCIFPLPLGYLQNM